MLKKEIGVDCRFHPLSFDLYKERLQAPEIAARLPSFKRQDIIGWTEHLEGS
jgi:hypothetical protein